MVRCVVNKSSVNVDPERSRRRDSTIVVSRVHISITQYHDIDRAFVDLVTPTYRTTSCMNARLTRALLAGTDRIHSTNARI